MRFFTDSMTSRRVVEMLRQLGADVLTVYEHGTATEKDDFKHVRTARDLGRIFITHDKLRAQSGVDVARELTEYGGKLIHISRGPEQSPYRTVGKLWFHQPTWEPFLLEHDGLVDIGDLKANPKCYLPGDYLHRADPTNAPQFIEFLQQKQDRREERRRQPRTPRPTVHPTEQREMDICPY